MSHDDGMAIASVIVIGMVVVSLLSVMAMRSVSDLRAVRADRLWEESLHTGDSGIDQSMALLMQNRYYTTGESLPDQPFADRAAERAWVLEQAEPRTPSTGPDGQWVVVKPRPTATSAACPQGEVSPHPACVVYSVGYTPAKDLGRREKVRVIKANYELGPAFAANQAVHTNGDLKIGGTLKVTGAAGSGHANGKVEVTSPATKFSGALTASGPTCTNCRVVSGTRYGLTDSSHAQRPLDPVPTINPRENYVLSEYDLCPDGTVRAGPSHLGPSPPNGTTQPCAGTSLATATVVPYRGWVRNGVSATAGAQWTYSGAGLHHGVYYVYQGSASWSGTGGNTWEVTVLAEADPTSGTDHNHCPHRGGDISISGNPRMRPYLYDQGPHRRLLLVAGRDLSVHGNAGSGDYNYQGALAAHEQFTIGGTPTIYGPLLSNDACNPRTTLELAGVKFEPQSLTGNTKIHYDGGMELPFGIDVRIARWEEL